MKNKKEGYKRVSLWDLQCMYMMRAEGKTVCEIAKLSKRAKSTVSNALTKHKHPNWQVWCKMTPYERADFVYKAMKQRRSRSRTKGHLRDPELRKYVIERLTKDHWSPEAIAGVVSSTHSGKHLSTKTIYNFIKHEQKDLKAYLTERGKPRRQRVTHRRGRFKQASPKKRSIEERPSVINDRSELGHWEGDTIVSNRGGKGAVLALRERVTRKRLYYLIPDLKAKTMKEKLMVFLETIPAPLRRTITLDNGVEFSLSELQELEARYKVTFYYCDPYQAWQKGGVENSNRELRWHHPKGTDFSEVTPAQIKSVEELLNRKPMKCHQYKSAEEQWNQALKIAA